MDAVRIETDLDGQDRTVRQFVSFPKIQRLNKGMVITEKLDGTNAAIVCDEDGNVWAQSRTRIITPEDDNYGFARWVQENSMELFETLGVGVHFGEWWGQGIQRNYGLKEKRFSLFNTGRWMSPYNDPDVALATECERLRGVLRMARPMYRESELGHGGIPTEQSWVISNYERRAALSEDELGDDWIHRLPGSEILYVVPVLAREVFDTDAIWKVYLALKEHGSVAAPGFMNPEGVVVYHEGGANTQFKLNDAKVGP